MDGFAVGFPALVLKNQQQQNMLGGRLDILTGSNPFVNGIDDFPTSE